MDADGHVRVQLIERGDHCPALVVAVRYGNPPGSGMGFLLYVCPSCGSPVNSTGERWRHEGSPPTWDSAKLLRLVQVRG